MRGGDRRTGVALSGHVGAVQVAWEPTSPLSAMGVSGRAGRASTKGALSQGVLVRTSRCRSKPAPWVRWAGPRGPRPQRRVRTQHKWLAVPRAQRPASLSEPLPPGRPFRRQTSSQSRGLLRRTAPARGTSAVGRDLAALEEDLVPYPSCRRLQSGQLIRGGVSLPAGCFTATCE